MFSHIFRTEFVQYIGGFRGGAEGAAAPPPFFKTFCTTSNRPGSRFIKCSSITNTITMLYAACRLKSKVFFRRGGGGMWWGLGPLFVNFLDPPLQYNSMTVSD